MDVVSLNGVVASGWRWASASLVETQWTNGRADQNSVANDTRNGTRNGTRYWHDHWSSCSQSSTWNWSKKLEIGCRYLPPFCFGCRFYFMGGIGPEIGPEIQSNLNKELNVNLEIGCLHLLILWRELDQKLDQKSSQIWTKNWPLI